MAAAGGAGIASASFADPQCTGAGVPLFGGYTLARRPRTAKILLPWLGLAAVCGVCWLAEMSGTVLAQSLDGTNMLRLHFNWVNGNGDGTLKDPWLWFYVKNIGLVFLLILPAVRPPALAVWRRCGALAAGGVCGVPAQQLR